MDTESVVLHLPRDHYTTFSAIEHVVTGEKEV